MAVFIRLDTYLITNLYIFNTTDVPAFIGAPSLMPGMKSQPGFQDETALLKK